MVGGSPSNTGNIDKDGELDEDDAGDDFKHTTKDDDGEVDDDDAAPSDSIDIGWISRLSRIFDFTAM